MIIDTLFTNQQTKPLSFVYHNRLAYGIAYESSDSEIELVDDGPYTTPGRARAAISEQYKARPNLWDGTDLFVISLMPVNRYDI